MWFGVRDLMLSRLMAGGQVFDTCCAASCTACTGSGTCGMCTNSHTGIPCSVCTWYTGNDFRQLTPIEVLAEAKLQLRLQLAAIEAQESILQEAAQPKSLKELDEIELRLQTALEELKKQRAKLENKVP